MREILATCVELDTLAVTTYQALSEHCSDADLATVFEQLAREEETHVGWWQELLDAWDQGLIPDVINDPESLLHELRQVRDDISSSLPDDLSALSPAQMVELAAHLEFFMLDPVFAELLELTEPGRTGHHREAYARHVEQLVGAIERNSSADPLARFLARVLKRALSATTSRWPHTRRTTRSRASSTAGDSSPTSSSGSRGPTGTSDRSWSC
jgi:hypothetical protein